MNWKRHIVVIIASVSLVFGFIRSFAADDALTLEEKVRFVVAETARIEDFNDDPKFQSVRREVIEAGDARYPVLKEILLDTKDFRVAIAAVLLMQGSGPKWERYGDERNELFRQILYDEIPVVDNDDSVKVRVADAMRFSGGVEEAGWLLRLFDGDSEPVTTAVMEVLGEIGDAEIADEFEEALVERAARMTPEEIKRDPVLYNAPAALEKMRARGVAERSDSDEVRLAPEDREEQMTQLTTPENTPTPTARPAAGGEELDQDRSPEYWPYVAGALIVALAALALFAKIRRAK